MAIIAIGTASFTAGGLETAAFTWADAILGTPVTFIATPKVFGGLQVVSGGLGPGVPYLDGAGAVTTTGGTVTCANPPTMSLALVAIG